MINFQDAEQIDLDFSDFEEVEKLSGINVRFTFPVIYIGKQTCFFNRAATPLVPVYFKWKINDEWCVLVPCTKDERGAYKSWKDSNKHSKIRFPAEISTSVGMRGVHKLYKTKNCLCFKRYEMIE